MNYPSLTSLTVQPAATIDSRPLVLKEGQLFHGQIKKLFPGQMAEVQIGSQKLFAKLEVPMKAGESYYFQVASVKSELQLKIISGPLNNEAGHARQLISLMDSMQLPKTATMQEMLSFAIKNKIPMTREILIVGEAMLKSVPPTARGEALATIQKMIELKLPFTENVFRSLLGVESKEGLHTVLSALRGAITEDLSVASPIKSSIISALDNASRPFTQATGGALLGQTLVTLLNQAESQDARFATIQLLKSAEALPGRTSLANFQQVLSSLLSEAALGGQTQAVNTVQTMERQSTIPNVLSQINNNNSQALVHASLEQLKTLVISHPNLSASNKEHLMSDINRAFTTQLNVETTTQFVREFGQTLIRALAENAIVAPFSSGAREQLLNILGQQALPEVLEKIVRNAEQSSHPAIQKQLQSAETAVAVAIDGKAVKEAIQIVIRSFGMNYEVGLLSKDADVARLTDTLKPQLLALMQDLSVSQSVRESAEMVVTRMNGPLLASSEIGVQHQLIMQVPLEFFGKRIDATMQWNGRMKDDGKIDPDFARILFYLDLHSLEKTIVDMQVQNRVISVTVYNADPGLKTLGKPMQEKLKDGLESVGYKLSGVFFKGFYEPETITEPIKDVEKGEQGVDFRI